jgi:TPR repeat protein
MTHIRLREATIKLGFLSAWRLRRFWRLCLGTVLVCFVFAHIGACQSINDLTAQGKSVLKDLGFTPEMVSLLEDKASKDDAKAQYLLGWMYFIGQSVDKSHEKTVQWMTKAAKQTFPYAQTQLGLMTLAANEMPGNYTFAREWLLKGAARNETDALNALGSIYSQGLEAENKSAQIPKKRNN